MGQNDSERRSPDQDAAIEQAFIAGKLPEEDRRAHNDLAPPADNDHIQTGSERFVGTKDELLRLLAACESETGYSQKEAFANLRKALS